MNQPVGYQTSLRPLAIRHPINGPRLEKVLSHITKMHGRRHLSSFYAPLQCYMKNCNDSFKVVASDENESLALFLTEVLFNGTATRKEQTEEQRFI